MKSQGCADAHFHMCDLTTCVGLIGHVDKVVGGAVIVKIEEWFEIGRRRVVSWGVGATCYLVHGTENGFEKSAL
eukprot:9923448-Ditylum_brightwellii.AAC.2